MDEKKEIAKYILKLLKEEKLEKDVALNILKRFKAQKEDIAIIGMSCRFAHINNKEEFWNNLMNEEIVISEFPLSRRKDVDRYLNLPEEQIKNEYFKGGFIEEVDKFDHEIFGIKEEEGKYIAPDQKIFLEIARNTLEDAGYLGKNLKGSKIGVYVGSDNTAKQIASYLGMIPHKRFEALIGNWISCLAGRVANVFDLKGPTFVVDNGCSSSSTAVHLACRTLQNKECDMVLAGGINIFTLPLKHFEGGMFYNLGSKEFSTRVFDKDPGGLYMSEGAGAVLLKPLSKAIEDKDNIYAVIKGSAVNNNGTEGDMAETNPQALCDVVVKGITETKINPETIEYFESHGDAHVLPDALEIASLASAFSKFTKRKQFCAIGSLNANIGYVSAAFGIAAVIKTTLALNKKIMPSTIGFQQPNPNINFAKSAFYICDRAKKWEKKEEHPRRAGLLTLGYGGGNGVIFLEEAPPKENTIDEEKDKQILTISAKTKNSLINHIENLSEFFKSKENLNYKDICYTMNIGRGDYQERVAILVDGLDDLIEKIEELYKKSLMPDEEKAVFYKTISTNLSMKDKKELDNNADKIIKEILEGVSNEESLKKLCKLYVDGGNIDWDKLYKGTNRYRCSLPTYPFDRRRSWFM